MRVVLSRVSSLQVDQAYKQSVYKQSGWLEPTEVSNCGAWVGAAQAIQAKQSKLAVGCIGMYS